MKKKKTVREERYETNRSYTFDRAMQEAARKSASHPKPVSMGTRVPENRKY